MADLTHRIFPDFHSQSVPDANTVSSATAFGTEREGLFDHTNLNHFSL